MAKSRTRKTSKKKKPATRVPPAFYERVSKTTQAAPGSMSGEFAEAVTRAPDAATRLRRFLKEYDPVNGEYQDAFHQSRVRAAQFELMRLEYLSGHVAAGDRLLARLQEVTE